VIDAVARGLIDLIDGYTGFVDQARNQVLDAGWGLVFGVILPIGLLAQLRRPERRIAGIQQTHRSRQPGARATHGRGRHSPGRSSPSLQPCGRSAANDSSPSRA
jgi:hypothetical protein